MNQKGFSSLFIVLGIILVLGIAGGAYYLGKFKNPGGIIQIQYSSSSRNSTVSNKTPVNNQGYTETRPTFKCNNDSDCILVKTGHCETVKSINKNYQSTWIKQDAQDNTGTCKVSSPEDHDINNFTTVCESRISTCLARIKDQTQSSLKPADSQTPASGICAGPSTDSVVTVTFGLDNIAEARCTKVTSNQKLELINNSNQLIKGNVGQYQINIPPNQSQTIDVIFGSYLLPGVHNIVGAEIWFQNQ